MNSAQPHPVASERRSTYHSFIVVGLLLLALGFVYLPKLLNRGASEALFTEAGYSYIVDLDYWRRTAREVRVQSNTRFDLGGDLNQVPLQFGDWIGQEKPDTNREVEILLEPEQYVRRLYRNGNGNGQYMWLSLLGGRSSQPFHPPDICYDADGWRYDVGSRGFALAGGGEIYGLWLDAEKPLADGKVDRHVVSYFYIFPNAERALADGIVLFKLTSNRIGTIDESLALHENFVQQFFLATQE